MKNTIIKLMSIVILLCIPVSMLAQQKEGNSSERKNQVSTVIPNDANQDALNKVVEDFKAAGVNLVISNVKRDESRKIIGMSIKATTKKGNLSSSFSQHSDTPLNPVQISYDDRPRLFIGSVGKKGMTKIFSSTHDKGEDVIVLTTDNDATQVQRSKLRRAATVDKKGHEENDEENTFLYRTNAKNTPLFVVNGKEVTHIEDIKPENIEAIYVIKDKKAVDKYGEKGRNGVVEIITKK